MQSVYIAGRWRDADAVGTYRALRPATGEASEVQYPVSGWSDCDRALDAACEAVVRLESCESGALADFLDAYATRINSHAVPIAESAARETALPYKPRLLDVELPRTTGQLREAASAARMHAWRLPTIDERAGLASGFGPLGPVVVFGPNNFPLAFNSVAGGDFAAAIAAGNPVIAKAHPDHPDTTRLLAELAAEAAEELGLPGGLVQVLWGLENGTGLRLVSDPRVGAIGFTGSRAAGLALKRAADEAGAPFYAEMSSVNPVFFLQGALARRGTDIAEQFADSVLLGAGQFCTCPNIGVLPAGPLGERFMEGIADRFRMAPPATLLSDRVAAGVDDACKRLVNAGAAVVCGGSPADAPRSAYRPTLLRVEAERFLADPLALQTEGFGPLALAVVAAEPRDWARIAEAIEGSLTGSVYFGAAEDDELRDALSRTLRRRVGRLLHNKMPTGVAVSPAMNHGGPFPATSHPGFTAVGLPASMRRFAKLDCYDNVDPIRRPVWLR
ncbi:MAG: aldehyde dehydrogenase family protein [Planctomycetota bacterium]